MRHRILAFILGLLAFDAWGQDELMGLVTDSSSQQPLVGAHVHWDGSEAGAVSNSLGKFKLAFAQGDRAILVISHTGYETARRPVSRKDHGSGALVIALVVKPIDLQPVEVSARPAPELVYQRADLHVGAYAVNSEGLWVLTYEKSRLWHRQERAGEQVLFASRLVLLDADFKERGAVRLPAPAKRLVLDHARRVIAEGEEEAWLVVRAADELMLERIALETLRQRVLPWTDSTASKLYGNNRNENYPAFDHVMHSFTDDRDRLICSVQDDFMMELFRSQYKYMSGHEKVIAMDLERETGVDRAVIAGFMTGFHQDKYFRMPYAPLFRVKDTLCVFDHAKERIRRFGLDGSATGTARMTHQQDRAFIRRLIQDDVTEQVYAVYQRGPVVSLRSVDARTGKLGPELKLTHPFPEEAQVHDGHAYYVYRPHGSPQKRTLYRERVQ